MDAEGFDVQQGTFGFIDIENCCDSFCFGNNPSSPYAGVNLPPGPGQTAANPAPQDDGTSAGWRLRADEAVVLHGRVPPSAKYAAFTPYLYDRADNMLPEGRRVLFASLGDSHNHLVVETSEPGFFGGEVAFVLSADADVEARVRGALVATGIPDAIIHGIPLRTDVTTFGLDEQADTFALLHRVALFDDAAAGQAYLDDPGIDVWRLTPREPAADAMPFGEPQLRPAGTGSDEAVFAAALDALQDAILAAHPGQDVLALAASWTALDGDVCMAESKQCAGDNRDARYSNTTLFQLQNEDEVVVYGVNHEATGKASYANFAVTALQKLAGVDGASSVDFPGSAAAYLPGHPDADKLYAYHVRRDCGGMPYCVAIPMDCPGVPENGLALITFRAYLEPATKTAPLWAEITPNRALRFRP